MSESRRDRLDHETPRTSRGFASSFFVHLALCAAAALSITPFIWLLCASVKRGEDLFAYTFLPWPHLGALTLDNFRSLFSRQAFGKYIRQELAQERTRRWMLSIPKGLLGLRRYDRLRRRLLGEEPGRRLTHES